MKNKINPNIYTDKYLKGENTLTRRILIEKIARMTLSIQASGTTTMHGVVYLNE